MLLQLSFDFRLHVISVSIAWRYHSLFVCSLTEGHIGCFQVLTVMNKAAINLSGSFPGGAVVGYLPAGEVNVGSSPGLGGSHVLWSGYAREPQSLSLPIWSLCSTTRGAAVVRGLHTVIKCGPSLPKLEKALAQKRRPSTAKNK